MKRQKKKNKNTKSSFNRFKWCIHTVQISPLKISFNSEVKMNKERILVSKFTQTEERDHPLFLKWSFMCLMSTVTSKTTACLPSLSLFPAIFGVRMLLIPSSSSCSPRLYHCHNIYPYSQLNLPFLFSLFFGSLLWKPNPLYRYNYL